MVNGEQTLSTTNALSWSDKLCRSMMLKIFSSLTQGQLILKEQGVLVDVFGERNTDLHAELDIQVLSTYRKLLLGGSVASGETYTDGLWTTPNLTNVIRIFARNLDILDAWEAKMEWLALPIRKIRHLANKNSTTGAKKNIAAHYDLGNKLYSRFLDNSMMYSAAIYPSTEASLAEAQHHKLQVICEKLQLSEHDHLLEIGTGWVLPFEGEE